MRPFLVVAELTTAQAEKFAVLLIDPADRREDGGVGGTIISLHRTREEADHAVASEEA